MVKYWAITLREMLGRSVAGKRSGQTWIRGLSNGWLWYWLQLKVHLCTVCVWVCVCAVSCVSVNMGGSTRLGPVGLCTGSFTRLYGLCTGSFTILSNLCTGSFTRLYGLCTDSCNEKIVKCITAWIREVSERAAEHNADDNKTVSTRAARPAWMHLYTKLLNQFSC